MKREAIVALTSNWIQIWSPVLFSIKSAKPHASRLFIKGRVRKAYVVVKKRMHELELKRNVVMKDLPLLNWLFADGLLCLHKDRDVKKSHQTALISAANESLRTKSTPNHRAVVAGYPSGQHKSKRDVEGAVTVVLGLASYLFEER